jgi:hypothetical protein
MKLILLLILFPMCLAAQEKKDTKIIVHVDTTGAINKIKSALFENGYTVESQDDSFIASTEKSIDGCSVKIRTLLKSDHIVITGQVANDVTISLGGVKAERTFSQVYYGGMKGSPLRIAWNEVVRFAKMIGTDITFSK